MNWDSNLQSSFKGVVITMTTCAVTNDHKFRLELKRDEGKLPVINLTAIEEVTVFDVAQAIYRDCYLGHLGINVKGLEAICNINISKSEYKLWISKSHNFEDVLLQVSKQMSV